MPPVDEAKEENERHWQAVEFRGNVEKGDVQAVEEALQPGGIANPTYKPEGSYWTVLMLAAHSGQVALTEKFCKGGRMPKVEEKDPRGFQAIMLAALGGHAAICQILLEKKADANAKDEDGETSLMKAAAQGHCAVVKLLLTAGADPDALDCNDMSAIKKAARWGHAECVRELLPKVKDDPRQLKHCLLFGRLYGHQDIQKIFEPEKFEDQEAIQDASTAVVPA